MGDTKDLNDQQAVEKIRELANDQICLFCTVEDGQIVSRPMSTQGIDDDGTLWFISRKDSEKNDQVNADSTVYLMYMNESKQHYLSVSGRARTILNSPSSELPLKKVIIGTPKTVS